MKKQIQRVIAALMLSAMLILCASCAGGTPQGTGGTLQKDSGTPPKDSGTSQNVVDSEQHDPDVNEAMKLRVHFIDVGQGDSSFIVLPDGKTLLIDAGESEYGAVVVNYIKGLGYTKIDYLVATHPHSDHIGGLAEVVRSFSIGDIYMPTKTTGTATYIDLLQTIEEKGLKIHAAKAGISIDEGDDWSAKFLSPVASDYGSNLNLYSAIVKIIYKNNSYLFMGDAEAENEKEILSDASADVIKVGHHGSKTSSTAAFVKRTGAKYAVFSVGEDNSYGHPNETIMSRWEKSGAAIYRTDQSGTIVSLCDGDQIEMKGGEHNAPTPEEPDPDDDDPAPTTGQKWVLNTSTKKIHKTSCQYAKRISKSNYAASSKSVEDLAGEGYSPCKSCMPTDQEETK